mmetsp:Transcript_18159/g.36363  ORF Transcript_18159/g.36363 Transcript_18159/m.36363 type:complete len:244 (+) Transcript_18159:1211-1942(+)
MEGVVPGRDDPEDAEGDVLHVGSLVDHERTGRPVALLQPLLPVGVYAADLLARRHHLSKERVHLRLSAVPGAHAADCLNVVHNVLLDGAKDHAPLAVGGLGPIGLGGLGDGHCGVNLLLGHGGNLAQPAASRRIPALNLPRPFGVGQGQILGLRSRTGRHRVRRLQRGKFDRDSGHRHETPLHNARKKRVEGPGGDTIRHVDGHEKEHPQERGSDEAWLDDSECREEGESTAGQLISEHIQAG